MLQRNRAETQPCYTEIVRPKWRNGRRAGLKNRWENIPCRFESDLRHQFLDFLLRNGSKWGRFGYFADHLPTNSTTADRIQPRSTAPNAYSSVSINAIR